MTFNTPVLTDRVPYTWDELKAHTVDPNSNNRVVAPTAKEALTETTAQKTAQGVDLKPLGTANECMTQPRTATGSCNRQTGAAAPKNAVAEDVSETKFPETLPAARAVDNDKLVGEIVEAVVPLIMERLHAQVSIMVDLTMKQAASKIRNDFDNALKTTVQSAVQKVVKDKLAKGS